MIALVGVNFPLLLRLKGTGVRAHRLRQVIEFSLCGPLWRAFVYYLVVLVDQYLRDRDRQHLMMCCY